MIFVLNIKFVIKSEDLTNSHKVESFIVTIVVT